MHHVHHMVKPTNICNGSTVSDCCTIFILLVYGSLVTTIYRKDMVVTTAATSSEAYIKDVSVETLNVSEGNIFIIAPGTGGLSFLLRCSIDSSSMQGVGSSGEYSIGQNGSFSFSLRTVEANDDEDEDDEVAV